MRFLLLPVQMLLTTKQRYECLGCPSPTQSLLHQDNVDRLAPESIVPSPALYASQSLLRIAIHARAPNLEKCYTHLRADTRNRSVLVVLAPMEVVGTLYLPYVWELRLHTPLAVADHRDGSRYPAHLPCTPKSENQPT